MGKQKDRSYSKYARQAMRVFAETIKFARKKQRWSETELAERAGISRMTVRKIEQGYPGTELGLYFEVAALLGIPLFEADSQDLAAMAQELALRHTLLPKRVHMESQAVFDDF